MILGLFPNMKKNDTAAYAASICNFLKSKGMTVVVEDDNAEILNATPLSSISPEKIDFSITLGGDGTILHLLGRHPELVSPFMPIHMGNLGFMADVTQDMIYPSLENLIAGKFTVDSRMMLKGTVENTSCYAVNDIVLHRGTNPCLVDLAIYIDDCYLNTFSADGVIIATPNGSTAYSLSAGGPIVTPELNAIILTPICPHTISNRPIVFLPKHEIRIEFISKNNPLDLIFDGYRSTIIPQGTPIRIHRAERDFKLVCMPNHDYYATLRTKLGWAGRVRQ